MRDIGVSHKSQKNAFGTVIYYLLQTIIYLRGTDDIESRAKVALKKRRLLFLSSSGFLSPKIIRAS